MITNSVMSQRKFISRHSFGGYSTQIILGLVIVLSICIQTYSPTFAEGTSARERFHQINNYIVYYGVDGLETLQAYDLAIIQPETLNTEQLKELRDSGTLIVAYLSLGEAESYRPWFKKVKPDWILGENKNWGSLFVDVGQTGWQKLMIEQAGIYLASGFDGIFLDTVDTVDAFPQTQVGMEELIETLRMEYPDAILIQNRGFTVLPATKKFIDGLMFEDLVTGYNFDEQKYTRTDNSELAASLQAVQKEDDLVILALDYADLKDTQTPIDARAAAQTYGFISFVSEISLQILPTSTSIPLSDNNPPEISHSWTSNTCPTFSADVNWSDPDGDIDHIIAAWGPDINNNSDGAEAKSYSVNSSLTSGTWQSTVHLECTNPSGDGCNVRFQAVDKQGNTSSISRTYNTCP